jgi:hypothetical protein
MKIRWHQKNLSPAAQNIENSNYSQNEKTYLVSLSIPKQTFNDDYPVNPKTFGERLRKVRMDSGLQITEFARIIGVAENRE